MGATQCCSRSLDENRHPQTFQKQSFGNKVVDPWNSLREGRQSLKKRLPANHTLAGEGGARVHYAVGPSTLQPPRKRFKPSNSATSQPNFKTVPLKIALQNSGDPQVQPFLLRSFYDVDPIRRVTIFHNPFTTVGKFVDSVNGRPVAIKQIRNARKYLDEIICEIYMLRYLNDLDIKNKFFPKLYDVWLDKDKNAVYIALQYYRYDLDMVLTKQRKGKVSLDVPRIKYFMWKSFVAIDILHRAGIIHRDVKPQNVLVTEDLTGVRLIDFGSACAARNEHFTQDRYTYGYIPPEVCKRRPYSKLADVWSAGCMWFELLHRGNRIIEFRPNLKQRQQQLDDNLRQIVSKLSSKDAFANVQDSGAIPTLSKMLKLDPSERASMATILESPYFARYRKAEREVAVVEPFRRPLAKTKTALWQLLLLICKEYQKKLDTDHQHYTDPPLPPQSHVAV